MQTTMYGLCAFPDRMYELEMTHYIYHDGKRILYIGNARMDMGVYEIEYEGGGIHHVGDDFALELVPIAQQPDGGES